MSTIQFKADVLLGVPTRVVGNNLLVTGLLDMCTSNETTIYTTTPVILQGDQRELLASIQIADKGRKAFIGFSVRNSVCAMCDMVG